MHVCCAGVLVCLRESVRASEMGRVTRSPRDFVSGTRGLSANVLALVCRPKERETRTRRLHKWIFEVKIEGSASFRLKHDRLRHRSIAARLKYPPPPPPCSAPPPPFSAFPLSSPPPRLSYATTLASRPYSNRVAINFLDWHWAFIQRISTSCCYNLFENGIENFPFEQIVKIKIRRISMINGERCKSFIVR